MTDADSATWTLSAAETGHLVFSGIHTRNAIGTVTRVLDKFPANRAEEIATQLSLGLRYVISQKLIPRQDRHGRIAVMEILNNTFSVANLIRQVKLEQIYSLIQTHTRDEPAQRMTTLERTLATLVKAGTISRAEAERACNEPRVLEDELQRE
jgi:twitching motility protein PilT